MTSGQTLNYMYIYRIVIQHVLQSPHHHSTKEEREVIPVHKSQFPPFS